MAKKFYQIADKLDSRKIAEFLSKDGQLLLPFLELVCNTEQAVDELAPYLVDKDPRRVVHHWQAMYRHAFYRGGPILTSALSGVEQALWDLAGKSLGVPVYQLFGGPPSTPWCHTYQSRFGLSRLERDSRNQGCSSELWFNTRSRITRIPRW